jgi:hypothetical protein
MKIRVWGILGALCLALGCTSGGTQSNLLLAPTAAPSAAGSSEPSPTPDINAVATPTPAPVGTLSNFQTFSANGDLVYPVALSAPIQVGNRIYLIGGTSDWRTATSKVQMATIAANGDLGSFAEAGTLSGPRSGAAAIQIGPWVYVFGGSATDREETGINTIERAPVLPDGALGPFETVSTTMVSARSDFNLIWTGPWVYAIGGMLGNAAGLSSVERAPVNRDGSLGAFASVNGVQLVQGRQTQAAAILGNRVYILGGEREPGKTLDSVETATIGLDGQLGAFSTYSSKLTVPRNRISLAALGNNLYLFGGYMNPSFLSSIDTAPLDTRTFALGAFTNSTTTRLAIAVESGASLVTPKYAYYFGGHNDSGVTKTIQRAPIQ